MCVCLHVCLVGCLVFFWWVVCVCLVGCVCVCLYVCFVGCLVVFLVGCVSVCLVNRSQRGRMYSRMKDER